MRTQYQFIHFTEHFPVAKRKTRMFQCVNNRSGDVLGMVEYYPGWRQYIFAPVGGAVFNNGCLADIQHFISQLAQEQS